jgi:SAM-dependent methyltransferase
MTYDPVQYDAIGSKYDKVKETPFNKFERYSFQKHIQPFIEGRDATVIDFACGTGFYSHLLLQWGAKSLTGVDISTIMLRGAEARLSQTQYASQARFIHGDGCQPQSYTGQESSGFDIATGVWFLPFASEPEKLVNMFKSISMNLKSDGVFVGVCNHPTDEMSEYASAMNATAPTRSKLSLLLTYVKELESGQGYQTLVRTTNVPGGIVWEEEISFSAYHFTKSIYEEAARAGGMCGRIEWHRPQILDNWQKELGFEDDPQGWAQLGDPPLLSILVAYKE